jgi:hypothetical protein
MQRHVRPLSLWNLYLDEVCKQGEGFLPAEIAGSGGMASGIPSCTLINSVPQETCFNDKPTPFAQHGRRDWIDAGKGT